MRIKVHIGNRNVRRPLLLLAAHHARQTLRRLKEIVPQIRMTLSEVRTSLDGLGKRCVVELKAGKSDAVVISARTWQDAIKLSLRLASERLTELSYPGQTGTGSRRRLVVVGRPRLR